MTRGIYIYLVINFCMHGSRNCDFMTTHKDKGLDSTLNQTFI
ncbi:hypothetical protein LINPERPRIM_LOCUS7121 [Linum perenne]